MNHDAENRHGDLTDPAVAAAYRDTASDLSPPHLDEKILHEAARELTKIRKPLWGMGWLRPVTFVATAGLSIALLLELTEIRDIDSLSGIDMNSLNLAPDATVDRDSSTQPAAAKATESAPAESRVIRQPPINDRENATEFRRAADETAKQVQAIDAAADARLQDMPKDESLSENAVTASQLRLADTPSLCSDNQRSNPEDWWLCVSSLRASGFEAQANAELQILQEAFPSYSPPE